VLQVLDAQPGFGEPDHQSPGLASGHEPETMSKTDIQRLEEMLSPTPTRFDDLARDAGVAVSTLSAALVELSLAGRVELLPGGYAVRR
jgi:DNA processing protein